MEVAEVEVASMVTRLVIVEEAELIKIPSEAVRGVRYAPTSVQLEDPPAPPTHVPLIAKHPAVRLRPLEAVEVAVAAPVRFK